MKLIRMHDYLTYAPKDAKPDVNALRRIMISLFVATAAGFATCMFVIGRDIGKSNYPAPQKASVHVCNCRGNAQSPQKQNPMATELEPFVSTEEAAHFLGIRRRELLALARRGIAGAYPLGTGAQRHIWVFRLSELASAITARNSPIQKPPESVTIRKAVFTLKRGIK
jgi:hypothetical protein